MEKEPCLNRRISTRFSNFITISIVIKRKLSVTQRHIRILIEITKRHSYADIAINRKRDGTGRVTVILFSFIFSLAEIEPKFLQMYIHTLAISSRIRSTCLIQFDPASYCLTSSRAQKRGRKYLQSQKSSFPPHQRAYKLNIVYCKHFVAAIQ